MTYTAVFQEITTYTVEFESDKSFEELNDGAWFPEMDMHHIYAADGHSWVTAAPCEVEERTLIALTMENSPTPEEVE